MRLHCCAIKSESEEGWNIVALDHLYLALSSSLINNQIFKFIQNMDLAYKIDPWKLSPTYSSSLNKRNVYFPK